MGGTLTDFFNFRIGLCREQGYGVLNTVRHFGIVIVRTVKHLYSIVNAMLRQQLLILIIFTVVYSYLFVGVDYKANPGVLTLYLLTFSIMGLLQTFTALYSTFYDSKDSKAYLPLPLKPSEVFLAKTLSGSMVGMTFMVPILSLLILAYWQFIGPLGIVVGLLSFIVSLFINLVFSVILSNSIGTLIVRSSRQKLYSTILMTLSTLLIMFPIMMVGFLNGYIKGAGHIDFPLLPYQYTPLLLY